MTKPEYQWTTGTVGEDRGRVDFERLLSEWQRGWWHVSSPDNKHAYRAWGDDVDAIAQEASTLSALLVDAAEKSRAADTAEEAVVAFVRAAEARHRAAQMAQPPVPEPGARP